MKAYGVNSLCQFILLFLQFSPEKYFLQWKNLRGKNRLKNGKMAALARYASERIFLKVKLISLSEGLNFFFGWGVLFWSQGRI